MNIVFWVLQVLLAVAMFLHGYVYVAWPASLAASHSNDDHDDRGRAEPQPAGLLGRFAWGGNR